MYPNSQQDYHQNAQYGQQPYPPQGAGYGPPPPYGPPPVMQQPPPGTTVYVVPAQQQQQSSGITASEALCCGCCLGCCLGCSPFDICCCF